MNCLDNIFLKSISRKDIFLLFGILLCLCFKFVHADIPDDLLIDDSFDALLTRAIDVKSYDGARQKAVKVGKALEDLFSCCGSINLGIVRSFGIDEIRWIADAVPPHGDRVFSVDWSSNGKYLAIGGYSVGGDAVRVYEFDTTSATTLSWIADGVSACPLSPVLSVNWSPDGNYLALGRDVGSGNPRVVVYKFDVNSTPTLQGIAYADTSSLSRPVHSVDWSPDGRYLAIGCKVISGGRTRVYEFDDCSPSLQLIADEEFSSTQNVYSVDWSPDGRYLASAGDSDPSEGYIRIYEFDVSLTQSLRLVKVSDPDPRSVLSLDWSPDGEFLVVGLSGTGDKLDIYQFDVNMATTLSKVAGIVDGSVIYSVNWASHGCYISALVYGSGVLTLKTYKFDPLSFMLNEAAEGFPPITTHSSQGEVKWNPNIDYLAAGVWEEIKVYEVQYSQGSPRYDGKGSRGIMDDIESRVDAIETI